jgi:hypothetical protein
MRTMVKIKTHSSNRKANWKNTSYFKPNVQISAEVLGANTLFLEFTTFSHKV